MATSLAQTKVAPTPQPGVREVVSIATHWRFQVDVLNLGEKEHWYQTEFNRAAWARVSVPKAWDLYDEALWGYEGVGWYATTLKGAWAGKDAVQRLKFDRVNYHSRVWLNGEFLGENVNGYLPFEFDVTGKLKPDADNVLVLRVDNRPQLRWLPGAKEIEWIQYGGILGPVTLESSGRVYLSDLAVNAVPEAGGASIRCTVEVSSRETTAEDAIVRLVVAGHPESARSVALRIPPGSKAVQDVSLSLPKASPWSPDTPFVYTLEATVERGRPVDLARVQFGVRRIEVRGREILLNGRRFRARGVNRYDEYGKYGPNPPRELLIADLQRLKRAGVNLVRMHYPQSPELLSLYDEMGVAVLEEVPVNWWGNNFSGKGEEVISESILDQAMPALERMIARDKNHACTLIWSMCNESRTETDVGTSVMRKLIRRAKELDHSRLVTFVISPQEVRNHRAFEDADLIAVNVYHGSLMAPIAHHVSELEELVTRAAQEFLHRQLAAFPDKPLLITEFGARGIPGLHGDIVYTEDLQAASISAFWKAIAGIEEISGGVLWSWADYYHRRTFIQYAVFGPYGVVTVDRRPKAALWALAEMYGGKVEEPATADPSKSP